MAGRRRLFAGCVLSVLGVVGGGIVVTLSPGYHPWALALALVSAGLMLAGGRLLRLV